MTATGCWMLSVRFLAPVASFVLLSATTRALIVPTDLPMLLPDKPPALADRAGTCRGMFGIPVGSWHSCAGLVTVTEFGPYLYNCTRLLLWLGTALSPITPARAHKEPIAVRVRPMIVTPAAKVAVPTISSRCAHPLGRFSFHLTSSTIAILARPRVCLCAPTLLGYSHIRLLKHQPAWMAVSTRTGSCALTRNEFIGTRPKTRTGQY